MENKMPLLWKFNCRGLWKIVYHLQRAYPVIVGTGHNLVFACLQFLPYLAQELDRTEEFVEVLSYSSDIIEYLHNYNISDGKKEIRFVLPEKELFEKVKILYRSLTIYYVDEVDRADKIRNLAIILGRDKLIQLTTGTHKSIDFVKIKK